MTNKPSGGFDLVLGKLYNDGWSNAIEPKHHLGICHKCSNIHVVNHQLEKYVFAFGKVTINTCTVRTCEICFHEEILAHKEPPPQKSTKQNLTKLFAKLPKSLQEKLLENKR